MMSPGPGDRWVEVSLPKGAPPEQVYQHVLDGTLLHHFWDEPWNPQAYVVRLHEPTRFDLDRLCDSDDPLVYQPWDATPDEEMFGTTWPAVAAFFDASSRIRTTAPRTNDRLDPMWATKLVHCFLNAQRYDRIDEAKWALGFAWNRLTIGPRITLSERWPKVSRLLERRRDSWRT